MNYTEQLPHPALRHLVRCYWRIDMPHAAGATHRVLPDGCMELILHYREPPHTSGQSAGPRALIGGQLTAALELDSARPMGMLGVRFHPWGAHPLLGFAMSEITGRSLPLEDIFPRQTRELLARLSACDRGVEAFRGLEHFLLTRLDTSVPVNRLTVATTRQLDLHHGKVSISALARQLNVSSRHLNREFQARVGLSPKTYARITRLQHCLRAVESGAVDSLADAAYYGGYSDQAHFSNEVRQLCGTNPGALLREGPRPGVVPGA